MPRRVVGVKRWLWIIVFYGALLGLGWGVGHLLPDIAGLETSDGGDTGMPPMIWVTAVIYFLASAVPFVPGAEIGLGLMSTFGDQIALLVYSTLVGALSLAFLAGRLCPPRVLARFFATLHMQKASNLVARSARMSLSERRDYLAAQFPNRLAPNLLRFRYLALGVALNIPGNSLIGGGGGLAMLAGMSRLYSLPGFLLTVLIAVAPIPFLVILLGYHP